MLVHQPKPGQPYNIRDYGSVDSFIERWAVRKKKYRYLNRIRHNLWIFFFLSFACRLGSIAFFGIQPTAETPGLMCILPKASSAQWHTITDNNPKIWMDRAGNMTLDASFHTFDTLGDGLQEYAGKSDRAFLTIDRNVRMEQVYQVIAILNQTGFNDIVYITNPNSSTAR